MNRITIICNLLKDIDKTIWKDLFKTTNVVKIKSKLKSLPNDELLYLNKNIFGGI